MSCPTIEEGIEGNVAGTPQDQLTLLWHQFYRNPSSQIPKKASPPGSGATSAMLLPRPQHSSQVEKGTGIGASRSPVKPTSTPPFQPFTCLPIVLSDHGHEPQRSEVHSPPQQSNALRTEIRQCGRLSLAYLCAKARTQLVHTRVCPTHLSQLHHGTRC